MKKNVICVLLVAVVITAVSVISMINNCKDQTFLAYTSSLKCNAQGDFKPEPFDNLLLAPISGADDQICSNQNEIKTEKNQIKKNWRKK